MGQDCGGADSGRRQSVSEEGRVGGHSGPRWRGQGVYRRLVLIRGYMADWGELYLQTSLLSAIIGEMNKMDGQVTVTGTVAYAPQNPWFVFHEVVL